MADPSNPTPSSRRSTPTMVPNYIAGRVGQAAMPPREAASPPPGLSGAPDPGRLLQALRRRWVLALALGVTLAGLAAAGAWNFLAPKHTAFIYIRVMASRTTPLVTGMDNRYEFNTYLKSQVTQLRSRFVLNAALLREDVKRLNLEKKYGGDVVTWLETELKVESAADNEMVKLVISSDDPDEARVLVNAVANTYIKEVVDKEEGQRAARVADLDRIYTQANGKLREKKRSLQQQAVDNKTLDADINRQLHADVLMRRSDTQRRHQAIDNDILQLRGKLETHKASEKSIEALAFPEEALTEAVERDPYIRQDILLSQSYRDRIALMRSTATRPEAEPRYAQLIAGQREVDRRIEERRIEVRKTLEPKAKLRARLEWDAKLKSLESDLAVLVPQEAILRKAVDELFKEAQKYSVWTAEIDTLKNEIPREETFVADIGKKLESARYDLMARPRVGIYHEPGLIALERKKQILAMGAGSMAALGMACMGVAFWEFRRRRVHSPDEVSSGLGIHVVGSVPNSAYVEQLINAPVEEHEGDPLLIESFDAIRTQLLSGQDEEMPRVLMVSSAGGGEGKTTLASHLASSLSRAGRRTLLIDGDLRVPAVHQFFEANVVPGLSEVLLGEVDTVDAILATNVDGLLILPAGQWDREVIASLARGGIQGILEKLKEEFDFIVIDSHPVLSANDSLLIGQHADAVILSVLREVSQTPRIYAAAQRLNNLGIRVLGAVVIGTDPDEIYTPAASSYNTATA